MRYLALRRIRARQIVRSKDPLRLAEVQRLKDEGHLVIDVPDKDVRIVMMNLGDRSKRRKPSLSSPWVGV